MYCGDVVGVFCDWVSDFTLSAMFVYGFHHEYLVRDSVLMCNMVHMFAFVGLLGDF